ncbi:hypothetical protein NE237_014458 [Protea cynaroides]|uniref:Uncharacterized protein n=1 Tax=Protea cynaroides TaxID=273540 RepID=A0A9Q0KC45_9MAGN|nr:hypothetical protein NE237_014458 [Protea cynaroides]
MCPSRITPHVSARPMHVQDSTAMAESSPSAGPPAPLAHRQQAILADYFSRHPEFAQAVYNLVPRFSDIHLGVDSLDQSISLSSVPPVFIAIPLLTHPQFTCEVHFL